MDEALATYSELLYYERYYPELANWWWFYRINFFNPQGMVNLPLYDFGTFKPYWYAVYMRGALFLRDLRAVMGDEAFLLFLQEYARQNVYHEPTAADFFSLLAKISPIDPGRWSTLTLTRVICQRSSAFEPPPKWDFPDYLCKQQH